MVLTGQASPNMVSMVLFINPRYLNTNSRPKFIIMARIRAFFFIRLFLFMSIMYAAV